MKSAALILLLFAPETRSAVPEIPSSSFGFEFACPSADGAVASKRLGESGCMVSESAFNGLAAAKPIDLSAKREWQEVGADSTASIFLDVAGAEALSYLIGAWVKVQYKEAQRVPGKDVMFATRILSVTFSCRDKTLSAGMSVLYDSQGSPIYLVPPALPGQVPFPADSKIPKRLQELCEPSGRTT
jgi:hypothetical protein